MRLFAALPLPNAAIERLLSLRLKLSGPKDGLRWSSPEQWHITLQFYGEVDAAGLQCLGHKWRGLNEPAPEVRIESLGLFRAKGILFAVVTPAAGLTRLQERVQLLGEECGLQSESRAFHPHVTLARSRGKLGHRSLDRLASPELPAIGPPLRWTAGECLLLQSSLSPSGAAYQVVARVALKTSAASVTA